MVSSPIAVALGVAALVGLLAYSMSGEAGATIRKLGAAYGSQFERADIALKPEEYGLLVLSAGAIVWIAVCLMLRVSLMVGIASFPLCIALSLLAGNFIL